MTIKGDELIHNCRECYGDGLCVKLEKRGESLVCRHNQAHRYTINNGFLEKI